MRQALEGDADSIDRPRFDVRAVVGHPRFVVREVDHRDDSERGWGAKKVRCYTARPIVGAEYGRQNFDDDGWSSESDDGRHPTQITRRPMHKWEVRRRPGVPIVVPSRPMLVDRRPTGADDSTPVWLTTEDIDAK